MLIMVVINVIKSCLIKSSREFNFCNRCAIRERGYETGKKCTSLCFVTNDTKSFVQVITWKTFDILLDRGISLG